MTTRAFVIGHPIAHSRSPLIHRSWLARYGIDGSYDAIDVAPAGLDDFLGRLRNGEFAGGNVTIPHKEAVFAACDERDPLAEQIGAVNTLLARDGRIFGTNTDYLGFLGSLDQRAPGWDQNLRSAIVLGAGGASRAILAALKSRDVPDIQLLNRTAGKAQALAEIFGRGITAHPLAAFDEVAPSAQLVVNASSIGLHGSRFENLDLARLPESALVTDIVYSPLITPLLAEAAARRLKTVDGLGMLLHQAAPGFELWFGVRPEVSPELRKAVEATL